MGTTSATAGTMRANRKQRNHQRLPRNERPAERGGRRPKKIDMIVAPSATIVLLAI